jgi:hypothetical protein
MPRKVFGRSFALPPEVIAWIEQEAEEDQRTPSKWLSIQLVKLKAEMEAKKEGGKK